MRQAATYSRTTTRDAAYTAAQVIKFILSVVEGLLAIRFILKLIGANASSSFTNAIYQITNNIVYPFRGIIHTTADLGSGTIDWATIIAAIVYAIIAYAIIRLFMVASRPVTENYVAKDSVVDKEVYRSEVSDRDPRI